VNDSLKEALVEQFRAHLDALDGNGDVDSDGGAGSGTLADMDVDADTEADLHSLFIELAALRSEVRTESRLVKDTLDLVRGVVERAEAERARLTALERKAASLRPLLIDLIEVRDRLAAGVTGPAAVAAPWYRRVLRRADTTADAWREGLRMTLARFDRMLRDHGVVPLDVIGKPFDPKIARAVGTVADASRENGIVMQEVRSGFLWEGEMLRSADVLVNKTTPEKTAREEGALT
jgi:molecular chaperone GrpE